MFPQKTNMCSFQEFKHPTLKHVFVIPLVYLALGEVLDCQLEWATGSWATMVTIIDWRLLCIITL